MAQIIAFVNPTNFKTLLADCEGRNYAMQIGFERRVGRTLVCLDGGNDVFYVFSNGQMESSPFNSQKSHDVLYLLVPETLDDLKEYLPISDFAVLAHRTTATRFSDRYRYFRESPNCWAVLDENEISGSAYEMLAKQLKSRDSIDFNAAWVRITRGAVSRVKEQFLSRLLSGDFSDEPLPRCLWGVSAEFEELKVVGSNPQNNDYIEAYRQFKSLVEGHPCLPPHD